MQNLNVNISLGFARYPDNCTSSSELLKCADEALYRAKREGKNTIRGYGDI
jgi:diguanylate cyclase (GGDEF)-like protein